MLFVYLGKKGADLKAEAIHPTKAVNLQTFSDCLKSTLIHFFEYIVIVLIKFTIEKVLFQPIQKS